MAKLVAKDPAEKLAQKPLSVLQLAEALGNVSEAWRRRGMDRTRFYEYKRRFQTHGLEGLRDLRSTLYESIEALQKDLDAYLHHYNDERPHRGDRNLGQRPIDTLSQTGPAVGQEGQ